MQLSFPDSQKDYWLVTGTTGLIGEYLLKNLLRRGFRLAVIVRPTRKQTGRQRIEGILQRWETELGQALPRPVVFEGDVTQPQLGLADDDLKWVKRFCNHFLHNAAILQFFGPCRSSEPWTTNVHGTRHAIDLAKSCGIEDFHFVSTAYVCGDRSGKILEDDFDFQQDFRNDYERSKFEAERLVREAQFATQPTIYRPVVVSGDSSSGYTSTYHGLYLYLRMIALLVPQQERDASGRIVTPIDLPMTGNEPRNIVPVDWVAEVMAHLLATPNAHGRTFHLAPKQGITPNQLVQHCYEYFGSTGVKFCGPTAVDRKSDNEFAAKVFDAIKIYEDYETSDPDFDCSNLDKFAGHLDCPELTREVIHRYIDFGEKDRWGRRKQASPEWPICGRELVSRLSDEILDWARDFDRNYGRKEDGRKPGIRFSCTFDLLGPGGGAWSIEVDQNGNTQVIAGVMQNPDMLLQMNVQRLQQWLISDQASRQKVTARWMQRAAIARDTSLSD